MNPSTGCTLAICDELLFIQETPQKVYSEEAFPVIVQGSLTVSF